MAITAERIVDWGASPARPVALAGDSVAVVDPATNAVVSEIAVGGRPTGLAIGDESVWVGNRDDQTLLRIDPESREVLQTISLGVEPSEIAVGAGGVWVLSDPARAVLRIDPGREDVVATIMYPEGASFCCRPQILVGNGSVWLTAHGTLSRIDPATNAVTRYGDYVGSIAFFAGALWTVSGAELDRIEKVDVSSDAVVDRFRLERRRMLRGVAGIAVADGALWITTRHSETVWKLDPFTGRVVGSVPLGRGPDGMAAGDNALWVAGKDRTLSRIEPRSGAVTKIVPLGVFPAYVQRPVAAGEGGVWVATSAP